VATSASKEELAAAVEALEAQANANGAKVKKSLDRWRGAHKKVSTDLAQVAWVAPVAPIAGSVVTYFTGMADAMVNSPDVRNPVTLLTAFVAEIVSGVAAWQEWPILAVGAGSFATATIAALTHDVGYAKGSQHRAQG
jgi:hypothetical protein